MYRDLNTTHDLVIEWAINRGIIHNGNTLTQSIKTLEEVHELINAIDKKDSKEIIDAYGDIFVTIVIGSYLNGTPLSQCASVAYDVIKVRKGYLNENGEFVKD